MQSVQLRMLRVGTASKWVKVKGQDGLKVKVSDSLKVSMLPMLHVLLRIDAKGGDG